METGSVVDYWEIVGAFDAEELGKFAQLKRLKDLFRCDPDFRAAATGDHPAAIDIAQAYGCTGDADFLMDGMAAVLNEPERPEAAEFDLFQKWRQFESAKGLLGKQLLEIALSRTTPDFDAWRKRERLRVASELGRASTAIPHSLIAFELARGCSVGCSFCGIDAAKFGGHVPYDAAIAAEWNEMLLGLRERFGEALGSGFLYWGSDPLDNPDYLRFANDFHRVTSVFPQVTTAVPLRNVELIEAILQRSRGISRVPHRFSILTLNIFRRVMKRFSPEDLLDVELVGQHKEALTIKANAGRSRTQDNPLRLSAEAGSTTIAPATIACVTGFLVNIAERTIKLVSPTTASKQWPNGYRIYDEAVYVDATGFLAAIDKMVGGTSFEPWGEARVPRFRSDLTFERVAAGFSLSNAAAKHRFPSYGELAANIASGERTLAALIASSMARGSSPGEEAAFIDGVFKAGLVEMH